jgi:hypothetical protein
MSKRMTDHDEFGTGVVVPAPDRGSPLARDVPARQKPRKAFPVPEVLALIFR